MKELKYGKMKTNFCYLLVVYGVNKLRNQGTQSTAIVGQIILSSSFTYKNFYYVFFSPISNEITTILRNNKENELHYLNFRFVKQFEFLWFKESLQKLHSCFNDFEIDTNLLLVQRGHCFT